MEKYSCTICHKFAAPTVERVLRHVGTVHSFEPNFHITCGIGGCPCTYRSYRSFRRHMLQNHLKQQHYEEHSSEVHSSSQLEIDSSNLSQDDHSLVMEGDAEFELSSHDPDEELALPFQYHVALFLLKAKEERRIPQRALDGLLCDVEELLRIKSSTIVAEITEALENANCSTDTISNVLEIIHNGDSLFHGLDTLYLQQKFFKTYFRYVEPIERRLGQSTRVATTGCNAKIELNWDLVYDVPLLSSLHHQLNNQHILNEVLSGHTRRDNILEDYCDGSQFRNHELFLSCPTALQIMLYYDELGLPNPLSPSSTLHKIGLFYYQLGNLAPLYRSSLNSIHLIAIANSSIIQKYLPEKILEPFMNDIKKLEQADGVDFYLGSPPQRYNFRGTLTLVSGDNIGSHFIGGYKQLSAALRKCRFCMATSSDMSDHFCADFFLPRTRQTHAQQCQMLVYDHSSVTYGLHRDSILNSSQFFHITDGLPPDIMHDVLEGSLQYETKELLKYLIIDKKFLSLKILNQQIERFPYMQSDKDNKPATITDDTLKCSNHSLKQKASKMWCLARYLPLMIGKLIPEDDEKWKLFLLLLTIIDYVFSPKTTLDIIAYVRSLINEHHTEFRRLYPDCGIIPKQHYMIHIPEWMERCGPMTRYWCMRYEAKHNYFKDLSHRIKCFKNIYKSLAERHQLYMCYKYMSSNVLCKEMEVGKLLTDITELPYADLLIVSGLDINAMHRINFIQINGIRYSRGCVVILAADDVAPVFGLMLDVLLKDVDDYLFVCEVLETQDFIEHFHAFKVLKQVPTPIITCRLSDLSDYHVVCLHQFHSELYIVLKYYIF